MQSNRRAGLKREVGDEVGGTPSIRLYETTIETALMGHFIQKVKERRPLRLCPHYTPVETGELKVSF